MTISTPHSSVLTGWAALIAGNAVRNEDGVGVFGEGGNALQVGDRASAGFRVDEDDSVVMFGFEGIGNFAARKTAVPYSRFKNCSCSTCYASPILTQRSANSRCWSEKEPCHRRE